MHVPIPKISLVGKVSSTLPNTSSISIGILVTSIGFQNEPKVVKHYKGIAKDLFHIQNLENNCFQDRGNYTTPIKATNDVLAL